MEHKIGEIVTLPNGRKAEVVEWDGQGRRCKGCVYECNIDKLFGTHCSHPDYGKWIVSCSGVFRSDNKNIIYKEMEESHGE